MTEAYIDIQATIHHWTEIPGSTSNSYTLSQIKRPTEVSQFILVPALHIILLLEKELKLVN